MCVTVRLCKKGCVLWSGSDEGVSVYSEISRGVLSLKSNLQHWWIPHPSSWPYARPPIIRVGFTGRQDQATPGLSMYGYVADIFPYQLESKDKIIKPTKSSSLVHLVVLKSSCLPLWSFTVDLAASINWLITWLLMILCFNMYLRLIGASLPVVLTIVSFQWNSLCETSEKWSNSVLKCAVSSEKRVEGDSALFSPLFVSFEVDQSSS